jgi:very-short-patch-repair endonuclease
MTLDITQRILSVAAANAGVCTRSALLSRGVTEAVVDRHRSSGMLRTVRPGVYLVTSVAGPRTDYHLAVANLPSAAISHLSAGRLRELPVPMEPSTVEVTIPFDDGGRRFDGVIVHRTRLPFSIDVITLDDGLPITSLARTVFDLASCLRPNRLEHVIQTAMIHHGLTADEFWACYQPLARHGVRGLRVLRRTMAKLMDDQPTPQSKLEAMTAQLLTRHGVSGFRRQYRPPWYDGIRGIVDFAHPQAKVVLETDGRSWHATTQAMAEDRRRDRLAAAHGWTVLRVVASELAVRPESTVDEIRSVVTTRLSDCAA